MKSALENAISIFKRMSNDSLQPDSQIDFEVNKKLLHIVQAGDCYYYVFNIKALRLDFVSPEIVSVLGYQPEELTLNLVMNAIHPEDVPWFLNFENKVVQFFKTLRFDQILKYKVRYDYRIKKSNGEYIRILQQVVALQYDPNDGSLIRSFGIHTDISYLKKEGKPVLSLIGMEGEPSYLNIDVDKTFTPTRAIISEREKQILYLLTEGKPSKTIADELFISRETVDKHRKNMLKKTNTSSTPELVAMALKKGWI